MKVGIIGAGRLGSAWAMGLKNRGFVLTEICSRSGEAVRTLADRLGMNFKNDMALLLDKSDVVLITAADAAIREIAEKISQSNESRSIRGKCFFHCSGSLTSDELHPLMEAGGYTASLHPLQTFAYSHDAWRGLESIYYGYEGRDEALVPAQTIINAFGGKMLRLEKEWKPLYHAAACMISNYTVVLSDMAASLLEKTGIDREEGLKALFPLLLKTTDNIAALGCEKALTGPIARGDYNVVEGHLNVLKSMPESTLATYRLLGEAALALALRSRDMEKNAADKLKKLLERDG